MSDSSGLASLSSEYRRFWEDARYRQQAISLIAVALESKSVSDAYVKHVDDAVAAGLSDLALPRGPVRAVQIEDQWSGWRGRKRPDCLLLISGRDLRDAVRRGMPDTVLRTWIHESLHARQLFSANAHIEYEAYRGYEEGLVESLTQIVLRTAGIDVSATAFEYYVAAYRALATELGVSHEVICRRLWHLGPGQVRAGFVESISAISDVDRNFHTPRFMGIADQLLSSTRRNDGPDERILRATWRLGLK